VIWHFFKKDFRLLWPMALALAALQALCAARTVLLGHFNEPRILAQVTGPLPILVFFGIVLVTISAVHQDPLPGVRQDWLTRPVKRRDVCLAKALFVLLLILGPIFLIDIAEQLTLRLPLPTSIAAAASRALVLLGVLGLPALVLGAITRSFADALIFAVAATFAVMLLFLIALTVLPPGTLPPPQGSMEWVKIMCALLVLAVAAVIALWFQYTHRRTVLARVMALAGVLLAMATMLGLPSASAMAIQRWTWGNSPGGGAIALQFVPDRSPDSAKVGDALPMGSQPGNKSQDAVTAAAVAAMEQSASHQYAQLRLPLLIAGMATGNILWADQITLHAIAADGTVYAAGSGACIRAPNGRGVGCRLNQLEIRAVESHNPGVLGTPQLNLPLAIYERIKDQPVRLELNFALTTFKPKPALLIGTSADARQLPDLGSCASRIDADGDEVELHCLTSVNMPSCIAAALEDTRSDRRNPELHRCLPDYAPFPLHDPNDVVSNPRFTLPFRDISGLAHYPVDESTIARAQIRLTTYAPVDHFRRTLVVPNIRLADWEAAKVPKSIGSSN
jgi:hypothetical protein